LGVIDPSCILETTANISIRNWTIHCSPLPAHASFRLVTALRLYNSFQKQKGSEDQNTALIMRWRDTILGHSDSVSEENEEACRESMGYICEELKSRAEDGIKKVKEEKGKGRSYDEVLPTLELLWLEERSVAEAVLII
jgi:hypothetical protein